mgnify:CR=1 FL=1
MNLISKDETWSIGGGCTAIRYDYGDYEVLVTNDTVVAPTDAELEAEVIEIGLYDLTAGIHDSIAALDLHGRDGLIAYYTERGETATDLATVDIHALLDLVVETFIQRSLS